MEDDPENTHVGKIKNPTFYRLALSDTMYTYDR
jgi:hypothetical protein